MIVRMKEVFLLVSSSHRDEGLTALRRLGVVHVHHAQEPQSTDITALEAHIQELDKVLEVVAYYHQQVTKNNLNVECTPFIEVIPSEILALAKDRDTFMKSLQALREIEQWFIRWGTFAIEDIKALEHRGLSLKCYVITPRESRDLPADLCYVEAFRDKDKIGIITVSMDGKLLPFLEELYPSLDYPAVRQKKTETTQLIDAIEKKLQACYCHYDGLRQKQKDLARTLTFVKVRHGMKDEDRFAYLKGFCPVDTISLVEEEAVAQGWGILIGDPVDPDEVPTLIKTPRWLEMISPVFAFIGTVPGYSEFDISLPFLLFFSLFFAMLIGDGGYGFVFLMISLFLQIRLKHVPQKYLNLVWVLSGATFMWGAVTGTWFGVEKIAQLPFFNVLIIDRLNSFVESNQDFMMYLSFVIGVVHLSVAHLMNALRFLNSVVLLSQIGWIAILWSLFFVAGNLVLGRGLPVFTAGLFVAGVALVAFFSTDQGSFLKRLGVSLGNLPLSVISSFSDVVSYLRLFAVGYASFVLAQTFNGIAGTSGGIMSALILFLGHALNITLGLMAVVVHGVRLNMLEFSGHLGMQWSGKEYKPFKE